MIRHLTRKTLAAVCSRVGHDPRAVSMPTHAVRVLVCRWCGHVEVEQMRVLCPRWKLREACA